MAGDGDEMRDLVLEDCREKMRRAISHVSGEFAAVRTGRASSALVEKLKVEFYGVENTLQQLASFGVPEARVLTISPYDKNAISSIEKAIQQSDLGVNPSNDGAIIRITFPELTEERRRDFVKVVRTKAEEGKVAVRNLRRQARHELEELEKGGEISQDDLDRAEKELEKHTHEVVAEIDELLKHKEHELLQV
jgi:ribosome recycling factor